MPSEYQNDEPLVPEARAPRGNWLISWLKNILTFAVLIGVVFASFWISFQLGKKILLPIGKQTEQKIQVDIPEPPPSIKALQKMQAAVEPGDEKPIVAEKTVREVPMVYQKAVQPAAIQPEPVEPAVVAKAPAAVRRPAARKGYFKVQAGLYVDKLTAKELADQISAGGFAIYLKKVVTGWRVQVGAFRTKAEALNLQAALEQKGFKSRVLFE